MEGGDEEGGAVPPGSHVIQVRDYDTAVSGQWLIIIVIVRLRKRRRKLLIGYVHMNVLIATTRD